MSRLQHLLALQRLRHFAVDDALRQTFDDRGLAHAGFADQHRVVLGAALQHLDRAADLVVAADHRVELALAGALGQVDGVFFQGFALAFGLGAADRLAAAHRVDGLFQRRAGHAVLLEQASGLALVIAGREQEHLGSDEFIAAFLRLLVGEIEQIGQVAPDLHFAAMPFHLGQTLDRLLQRGLQRRDIAAGARQQRSCAAVGIVEQGQQQVLRLDELVVAADRQTLGIGQRLLELGGKFVETHESLLLDNCPCNGGA